MKDIPVKVNISAGDDTGSPTAFGANELNSMANELENTVTSTGQTLSTGQTPDTNVTQLARALVIAGQSAMSYNDSGAANAYVLTAVVATLIQPIGYFNGMRVSFTPDIANTGTSTINVSALGVKAIRTVADANITAGVLLTTRIYNLVYVSSYAGGSGAFVIDNSLAVIDSSISAIDDKYLPDNVEKLLLNDTSVTPGTAHLGRGYQGTQSYGQTAVGAQYYGLSAFGPQYYGRDATGAIEIGSTAGTPATKKLISGAKEATFEEIIDTTGLVGWESWQTPTYETGWFGYDSGGDIAPLKYRRSKDLSQLQLSGSIYSTGTPGILVFSLPVGYRPTVGELYDSARHTTIADARELWFRLNGEVLVVSYTPTELYWVNAIIPLT